MDLLPGADVRHAVHGRHDGLFHQLAVHVRRECDGQRLRLRILRVLGILRHDALQHVGNACKQKMDHVSLIAHRIRE